MHSKSICSVWEQNCRIQNGVVLCRRSGQWYELQNDFLTAFCYYHTAGDYDKMLTVFEKDRGCSFENNYKNKIMAYFGEAPETIRQKHTKRA